jgi:hypothetical protein
MRLLLPDKHELLAYSERALAAADGVLSRVDDAACQREVPAYGGRLMTIGAVVADNLEST